MMNLLETKLATQLVTNQRKSQDLLNMQTLVSMNSHGRRSFSSLICHLSSNKATLPPLLLGPPGINLPIFPHRIVVKDNTNVKNSSPPPSTGWTDIPPIAAYPTPPPPPPPPPMGRTENFSPTYLSSGNPCLDFFFHVVPDTPRQSLIERLEKAWEHDPLTTLKLICNLRGVRGTGKSDKEGFYTAALWLHENHPKTLACNVKQISEFGYLKDMPEILYRLIEGLESREIAKKEREEMMAAARMKRRNYNWGGNRGCWQCGGNRLMKGKKPGREVPAEERVARHIEKMKLVSEQARVLRHERRHAQAAKAIYRYRSDPNYRFLYDKISDLFAELLISDCEILESQGFKSFSLASKWCPSLDSSFDLSTLLCESIAKRVFPRTSDAEYQSIKEAYYAYRVRDRLRKQVLVPLRQALQLPEIYISKNKWNILPYDRVASVAMKTYTDLFMKHDETRFKEYLLNVKSGKATIAAGALLPHEITDLLNDRNGKEVAELQWKRMVDDLSKIGKLNNCMAICDVSGSMFGKPMKVSVALGLLISELSEDPWKGKLITFSENPELHIIKGETLREKTSFIEDMEWGMNTDFQKVFDRILEVAVQEKLEKEKMIKTLFVFSDMEFDTASLNDWETDYMVITKKFEEKGYIMPEIVFWNLRNSRSTPVTRNDKGVAMVSGFSKNMVKLFLDGKVLSLTPETVMMSAISGLSYENLLIYD